jgi:plasmid stabilization system protein ParE
MAYRVSITARAERDLAGLFEQIGAEHSEKALEWYLGLRESVRSVKEMPNRCPVTLERAQLRHLLYGQKPHIYRVIYRVLEKEKRVDVLHIRHGARQEFTPADLDGRIS